MAADLTIREEDGRLVAVVSGLRYTPYAWQGCEGKGGQGGSRTHNVTLRDRIYSPVRHRHRRGLSKVEIIHEQIQMYCDCCDHSTGKVCRYFTGAQTCDLGIDWSPGPRFSFHHAMAGSRRRNSIEVGRGMI